MNKLFTKIAAFALGSSMAIGVGVAVAGNSEAVKTNATASAVGGISFKTGSITAGNTSTQITGGSTGISTIGTETTVGFFNSKVTSATYCYYSASGGVGGIRVGKSSGAGTIQFTLATSVTNALRVDVESYQTATSNSNTLRVDESSSSTVTPNSSTATVYQFDLSDVSNLSTITLKTSNQVWIKSLVLYVDSDSGDTDPQTGSVTLGTGKWTFSNTNNTYTDNLDQEWTGTVVNNTGNNYTQQTGYTQIGSGSSDTAAKWASSVTFTTSFSKEYVVTDFSVKVGGFSGTAGSISLKVGSTEVGSGSFSASTDVTVEATNKTVTSDTITILLTGGSSNGRFRLKVYNISYTIESNESPSPSVEIFTGTTSLTYDGSNNQNVAFSATPSNFEGTVTYVWASSNTSVISVTGAGTGANANLKIVGQGSANITATGTGSNGSATSNVVALTVTNETYSGTLTINNSSTANVNSNGTIAYTLSGNTHPMNVATYTSSNTSAISFADSHNPAFTTGSTKGSSATVTLTLSSSTYSLETYQKSITITLVDPDSVTGVHFTGNITSKTVNFGGNYNLTAVLECESGNPTDTEVSWASADSSILTVPNNETGLTCALTPVSPGQTTVTVTTHDGGFTKTCTVTVNSSSTRTLDSVAIDLGENAKTSYYDDDTEIDLTDISLTAHYVDQNYQYYDETVDIENDAEGVEWELDLANQLVIVTYTVDQTEVSDSFAITVSERPSSVTFLATDHTDWADGKTYNLSPFTIVVTNVTHQSDSAPIYNTGNQDVRLYVDDYFTITSDSSVETIDSIEYVYTTKDSGKGDDYSLVLNGNDGTGSYSKSGTTLTFSETTEVKFVAGSNQIRFKEFTINYTKVTAQDKDVESVELSSSSISLESGESYYLSAEVLPADARDTSVTWSVTGASPSGCVTVDQDGTVHAVAVGSATVVATSNDQNSIYDECTVTVTQGPIVNAVPSAAVSSQYSKISNVDFTTSNPSGASNYNSSLGAQFGSNDHNANNVTVATTDLAFATNNFRVVVNAAYSGDGSSPSVSVNLGSTSIGSSQTLTKSSANYEFEFSGSGSNTVDLTNLVTITLHNGKGAVYLKSIKIYSAASQSVVGSFVSNDLRMETYDQGGTQGSTGGNGSCKAWWNDVVTSFDNLTDGQKALFNGEDQYEAARERLSEWSRLNGYVFDTQAGTLTQSARTSLLGLAVNVENASSFIVVLAMLSLTVYGGYFFLRKKKEQ